MKPSFVCPCVLWGGRRRWRCTSCDGFHFEICQVRESAVEVDNVAMFMLKEKSSITRIGTYVFMIMFALNRVTSISRFGPMIDRFDSGNRVLQADKQMSSCAQIAGMFWSTGVFREMTRSKFLASPTTCANDEKPGSSSGENSRIS